MAREIRKKVIDHEIQPSGDTDHFDEKMLEQIEKEFDQITISGGNLKSTADPTAFEFFDTDAAKTGFSLDDFDTPIDNVDTFPQQEETRPAAAPAAPAAPAAEESKGKYKARIARKKIIIICLACVLLLLVAGFTLVQLLREQPSEKQQVVRMIRHRITIQYYQEQFDFLILANAQREKDLISLGIEFEFPTVDAFEDFQKENVILRDVIYQFLQGERPIKNSHKYWQQIVESSLLNYLKAIFPKSGMSSVRMVYLDRL